MIIVKKSIQSDGINRKWLHVIAPTAEELTNLAEDYYLDIEELHDVLDLDELARFDILPNGCFIIMRLAMYNPDAKTSYSTLPMGIFLLKDTIITVANEPVRVVEETLFKGPEINMSSDLSFILSILLRSNYEYLAFLKGIRRQIDNIEKKLNNAIANNEIIGLLSINKSLEFFVTSLRSNDLLALKLKRTRYWQWNEVELDLLEDVNIENREASTIANIYTNILKRFIEVFAVVINNNLNHIMKRLAAMSFVIAVPTFITGIYGMNVDLPLEHWHHAFSVLMGGSILVIFTVLRLFKKRRFL